MPDHRVRQFCAHIVWQDTNYFLNLLNQVSLNELNSLSDDGDWSD